MEQLERRIIEAGIRELLSTKHLYQRIELDFKPAIEAEAKEIHIRSRRIDTLPSGGIRLYDGPRQSLDDVTKECLDEVYSRHWYIGEDKSVRSKIQFSFPPTRTLCSICDEVEAFNLFGDKPAQVHSLGKEGHQVFSFTVQCQRCKACVIVFLVKRNGPKIQLVGRSEFEEAQVPSYMPKSQSRFYSQAMIAFQCGQVLAGLFMLRTLVEQHMRTVTKNETLRGEDLCDEYTKQLGQDVSGQIPSFKKIYGELSNALHRAEADEEIFESQCEQICFHFEEIDLNSRRKAAAKSKSLATGG